MRMHVRPRPGSAPTLAERPGRLLAVRVRSWPDGPTGQGVGRRLRRGREVNDELIQRSSADALAADVVGLKGQDAAVVPDMLQGKHARRGRARPGQGGAGQGKAGTGPGER